MNEDTPHKYALKNLLESLSKSERNRAVKNCHACVAKWRFKRDRYAKTDSNHEMRAIDALIYCEVFKVDLSDLFGTKKIDIKKTVS